MPRKRGKRWYYDIALGNGQRYRRVIPLARTKSEAETAETIMRAELFRSSQGIPEPTPRYTLRRFVTEKYIPYSKTKGRRKAPATKKKTRRRNLENPKYWTTNVGWALNKLVEAFGDRQLDAITHLEFEAWLIEQGKTLSAASINAFIKRMKAVLNYALKINVLATPPNLLTLVAKRAERPKTAKRRLSREDQAAIVDAAKTYGFEYVAHAVTALVETGLRPSELYEMDREAVELSKGCIQVYTHKGGGKARTIPLTDAARAAFEWFLDHERRKGKVFPVEEIKNRDWKWITGIAAKEQANCAGYWLRWLRSECENRWIENGMHPMNVMLLMGHESASMSLVYNNPLQGELLRFMSVTNTSQAVTERNGLRLVNG